MQNEHAWVLFYAFLFFLQRHEKANYSANCNCKFSNCAKKYCDCFKADMPCGELGFNWQEHESDPHFFLKVRNADV